MHLNKFISDVIENAGATHYIGFFGSKKDGAKPNFRYALDPNYKLNRPETPEWVVKWRPVLFEVMENKWGFTAVDGMEADDACAIAAKHFKPEYDEIIIAACDKDLKQIPGVTFYDYSKHQAHLITAFDAALNLGIQALMGDSTDNIKGLDGIGPKKAAKVLSECTTITQIKWTVARMYAQYEMDLRAKMEKSIFEDTKSELMLDDSVDKTGLTEKQIDRLVRIAAKKKLENTMTDSMAGGWKKYLRTQYALVTLLTECPDWFTLPEPKQSKLAFSTPQETVDTSDLGEPTTEEPSFVPKKPVAKPIDNFLYL
jgi:5'-3' exonuclease